MLDPTSGFASVAAKGYRPIPIIPPGAPISPLSNIAKRLAKGEDPRGKVPGVKRPDGSWTGFDWVKYEFDHRDISRWASWGSSIGIKTGACGDWSVGAIDADLWEQWSAKICLDAIVEKFGHLPIRIGKYPKALYVFRYKGVLPYTRIDVGDVDGAGKRQRVEILTDGRQFVAEGVHPQTGKPYTWPQVLPALNELPEIAPERIVEFLGELGRRLPRCSAVVQGGTNDADIDQPRLLAPGTDAEQRLEAVRAAAAATPNTNAGFAARENYLDFGYAIKAAVGGDEAGLSVFQEWCSRWTDGANEADVVTADWNRMKPPYRRGWDWLASVCERASNGGWTKASTWWEAPPEDAAARHRDSGFDPSGLFPLAEEVVEEKGLIRAAPAVELDAGSIPRRESLYGGHYVRQFVSTTLAPSKVGKSSLGIVEALAMCTGRPLLGVAVGAPLRVWIWNGEDPLDEINRRVAAAMKLYGVAWADVGGRLFLNSGRDTEIVIGRAARDGAIIAEPVVRALKQTIAENAIDVVLVDPFVSSHRVSENDNGAIDAVAKKWANIADVCRCAVDLVHHVRKLNGSEVTVEDGRGATALIAASRSARALARMTKVEGARLGLSQVYRRLFRFADTSSNLAIPADGDEQKWLELASVNLENGGGDDWLDQMINGDSVGVVRQFDMPAAASAALASIGGAEALSCEEKAMETLADGSWRKDSRAGDGWAGAAIMHAYGLDGDEHGKEQANSMLTAWLKNGKVRIVSKKDKNYKPRDYVVPVQPVSDNVEIDEKPASPPVEK